MKSYEIKSEFFTNSGILAKLRDSCIVFAAEKYKDSTSKIFC